jgi:V8-like Glu-specific endopeptidase
MDLNWLLPAEVTHAPSSNPLARVQSILREIGSSTGLDPSSVVSLESVIAADDRIRVENTIGAPWRRVCCLTITGENGAVSRGTAFLVGPRTLLTAGHCVYSTVLFDGWAKSIVVEAGRNGLDLPFGSVTSTWFSTLVDWVQNENPNSDVGCIQLEEPVGDTVGWFTLDTDIGEQSSIRPTIAIAGYPVDRDGGNSMYTSFNQLLRSTPTQLFYDVDTVGGQSGAPVWVTDTDGDVRVIGIHAYGASGKLDPVLNVEANSGRRISSELLVTIVGWLNENR